MLSPVPARPTGIVTFFFTDIEGSTRFWERDPLRAKEAVARHDALLRRAIETRGGYVFKTVGDAFCAAFSSAPDALATAASAQRDLAAGGFPFKVRMGLHAGTAEERDGDYFGPTVNRVARLMSLAVGGQTLVSEAVVTLLAGPPEGISLRDLGTHRLKDLSRPERVWQVVDPALPSDFPPLKSVDAFPNNLPRLVTSFVGRDREMAEVEARVRANRLVTLVGAGGVGKTRLAIQAAGVLLGDFDGGAWLVNLAPLSDPALLDKAVAGALGVREEPARPLLESVASAIGAKSVLLVLDNAEHLLDACAAAVDSLLSATPRLHVLVTSREPLGVFGETTWRVPSLGLSAETPSAGTSPGAVPSGGTEGRAGAEGGAAAALFAERARAVAPSFALTAENLAAVLQICRRLDGIPLAIELAAARAAVLSPAQIAERLDDRFRLLTGGSRTALPRQRTLEACIAWGWGLLDASERALLSRLSVFSGGCDLEAAEAVCAGPPVADVLDGLTRLAAKSFVSVDDSGPAPRYALLETIRQYARDRLIDSGESDSLRRRHRDHYLALAERAEPHLVRSEAVAWLARLDVEAANHRSAIDSSAGGGPEDAAKGLRLVTALRRHWMLRGHLREGRERVRALREAAGAAAGEALAGTAFAAEGLFALWLGEAQEALSSFETSLALRRRVGDERVIGEALGNVGAALLRLGRLPEARRVTEEALAIRRRLGDPYEIGNSLVNLGAIVADQGDLAFAQRLSSEAIERFRAAGSAQALAMALSNLGYARLAGGDVEGARRALEEQISLSRSLGDRGLLSNGLNTYGVTFMRSGDPARARAIWEEALSEREALGNRAFVADTLVNLAHAYFESGDREAAVRAFARALSLARDLKDPRRTARVLGQAADIVAWAGSLDDAARLNGAAERALEGESFSPTPWDRRDHDSGIAGQRETLGAARWDACAAEGGALDVEAAGRLAAAAMLSAPCPPAPPAPAAP